jgi:hypothetical protein
MRSGPVAVAAASCAVLAIIACDPVIAAAKTPPLYSSLFANEKKQTDQQYFVDFRARPGILVGHSFIAYGHLNTRGQLLEIHYAGIYPKDERAGLIIGSVIPVRASVRAVDGDFEYAASIIYRWKLTAAEFVRLKSVVRRERATEHYWHILFFNCNDFPIKIAKSIGLRTPPSLLLPKAFVAGLRALNGP